MMQYSQFVFKEKDLFESLLYEQQIEDKQKQSSIQQQNPIQHQKKRADTTRIPPSMPFKKQLQVFYTILKRKIQSNKFLVPNYFSLIFIKKSHQILTAIKRNRVKDISLFLQFWTLVHEVSKYDRYMKKRVISIIYDITKQYSRCRKGKNFKIRMISERILKCVEEYEQTGNLELFMQQLWGPIIKKTDFQNFYIRASSFKKQIDEWIGENMNTIERLRHQKE